MDKVATISDRQRSELFEETATRRAVHPAIIEKDFWVCWVLKKLFGSEQLTGDLVFKGGTSLSKVYRLIDRFSEDIDLVLNWERLGYGEGGQDPWEQQPSNTKQDRFNAEFNERAANYIRETLCPLVERLVASCPGIRPAISENDPQVIDIRYPAAFNLEALRPEVKLEIGPLASWVPSDQFIIQPYAAEEFGRVFDNPNCPVVAIKAERTFWEKATILHQQAHRTADMPPRYFCKPATRGPPSSQAKLALAHRRSAKRTLRMFCVGRHTVNVLSRFQDRKHTVRRSFQRTRSKQTTHKR